ncbi:helix-turn-helix transcriptional regulator [Lamprobacter modestohalophilus]|uniref:helix-turn-helix domain-containing protein n=1 Tax=Lamprobacter modestohalophilus TaxID=1064514 RepID=UPI002ADEBDA9|nr:helix-turn-helix transcriptional regulator [Lamprobacter modestohalophilus]MEA1051889.1 helix-turn-helix transcriptional regulator [Lamprobacter modestohalophilus]
MPDDLHPAALKHYRTRRGLSQQQLADESNVSKIQISRYERGLQNARVGKTNRDRLCKALRVKWEQLTQPPENPKEVDSFFNRVALKASIAGEAKTAFTFLRLYYGLREEDVIDLAPVAALILIERSLQARKRALDEALQTSEDANATARARVPYMADAFLDFCDWEWIEAEQESLQQREVFVDYVNTNGEESSPFVAFLESELNDLGLFRKYPIEIRFGLGGTPLYAIHEGILAQLTGLDPSDEADRRLLELIQEGQIDLAQAIEKKDAGTQDDYRIWLDEQRQAIEDKIVIKRTHFLDGLDLGGKAKESTQNRPEANADDDPPPTTEEQP